MDYDTALITTDAQVSNLTGRQGTSNLENSDFTLATFLLNAHRWVYRQLERRGIDPTDLTNQTRLEAAVALYAVGLLVGGGHIKLLEGADAAFYQQQAQEEVDGFVPALASTTARGRDASEGLPMVGNFEDGINFQLESGPGQLTYRRSNPRRLG